MGEYVGKHRKCSHCNQHVDRGWLYGELLQMMADGAYPPSTCAGCWYRVSAAALSERCESPDDCPHVVAVLE